MQLAVLVSVLSSAFILGIVSAACTAANVVMVGETVTIGVVMASMDSSCCREPLVAALPQHMPNRRA